MSRRNPMGGGLLFWAAALGGLYFATRKKDAVAARAWPGEEETGWAVNTLCTNADLMDADASVAHADEWFQASGAPPFPVSPLPVNTEALAIGISDGLDRYFASVFPQCERAPSSLLFGDVVTDPAGLATETAQMLQKMAAGGGAAGDRLNHFAAALVGH